MIQLERCGRPAALPGPQAKDPGVAAAPGVPTSRALLDWATLKGHRVGMGQPWCQAKWVSQGRGQSLDPQVDALCEWPCSVGAGADAVPGGCEAGVCCSATGSGAHAREAPARRMPTSVLVTGAPSGGGLLQTLGQALAPEPCVSPASGPESEASVAYGIKMQGDRELAQGRWDSASEVSEVELRPFLGG